MLQKCLLGAMNTLDISPVREFLWFWHKKMTHVETFYHLREPEIIILYGTCERPGS